MSDRSAVAYQWNGWWFELLTPAQLQARGGFAFTPAGERKERR